MRPDRHKSPAAASAALALCCLLGACPSKKGEASREKAPSRVVAVAADDGEAGGLCDEMPAAARGAPFSFPSLTTRPPDAQTGRFRWVNLWATWCPPCVEELALIKRYTRELNEAGIAVDLSLLSVDQTDEVVTAYQAKHPEAQGSLRVKDPLAVEGWLSGFGLGESPALPIHLFVGPDNKLRCVRSGALGETDFPKLKAMLTR